MQRRWTQKRYWFWQFEAAVDPSTTRERALLLPTELVPDGMWSFNDLTAYRMGLGSARHSAPARRARQAGLHSVAADFEHRERHGQLTIQVMPYASMDDAHEQMMLRRAVRRPAMQTIEAHPVDTAPLLGPRPARGWCIRMRRGATERDGYDAEFVVEHVAVAVVLLGPAGGFGWPDVRDIADAQEEHILRQLRLNAGRDR